MSTVQHSDGLSELASALSAAQAEFESVSKDAENPFFKSKYASLPTVVKTAAPILAKHGLSVSQLPGYDDGPAGGDTLTTMLLHKSGEYMSSTMRLRPVKDDPQAQGSAITYARRYSFMAALGLVADQDDDGNAASQPMAVAAGRGPQNGSQPLPERYVDYLRLSIRHHDKAELADEAEWQSLVGAANTPAEKAKLVSELEAALTDLGGDPVKVKARWTEDQAKRVTA